jgi:hypothetical protein
MDSENQALVSQRHKQALIRWPTRLLGPRPGLKEIHLACWGMLIGFVIFPVCFGFWVHHRIAPGKLPPIASGFTYFYGVGKIVDQYPPQKLYDAHFQEAIFNQIWPIKSAFYGPSPYPPFVALFFSLLARLPFNAAYFLWIGIALLLYIAGVYASARLVFSKEPLSLSLFLCLALAYYPFFYGTLLNGRISSIEVCSVGIAILLETRAKPFRSGLALSFLTYKPTLLLLVVPMLLLTRRFKAISGFLAGFAVLATIASAFTGLAIWPEYLRFLVSFGKSLGNSGRIVLNYARYIDGNAFLHSIAGGRSPVGRLLLAGAGAAIAIALATLLWRSARGGTAEQYLAWAATLTWTLILNVYVPIYDSVLVVIAIALTLGALRNLHWTRAAGRIQTLSLWILAASWVSERLAEHYRVQILSILLAALAIAQLVFLRRAILARSEQRDAADVPAW